MDKAVEGQDLLNVQSVFAVLTTYVIWPIGLVVYYVLLYLAIAILFLAKILYTPVGWLLQPIIYMGQFLLIVLWTPFRLLAKLETLYIYLGVAAVVGLAIGAVMRYLYGSLSGVLHLDTPPARSAKEYRQAKRREKEKTAASFYPPLHASPQSTSPTQPSQAYYSTSDAALKSRHGKGLLNQTIMEEMDSDY
ncbi:hypothetical protein LTR78_006554 [Recurvomyces mirabilis]|uniref:Uncharacterized protein n=1 Tax=Recurvomyces mirabilis TaxID=574656 RepID=A0AAE0WKZ6_9PEZI|nr:hypothetical protein LTR78_006554 [Recurvomyces mirabilis]KAK5151028.1 hypothetical protein LTS14_009523 [Recurvomyces mirabilis]